MAVVTVQERPAGRPACGARPAGAPNHRIGPVEYARLRAAGVSHDAAVVLAWPPALGASELAYWRALQYRTDPADVPRPDRATRPDHHRNSDVPRRSA